MFLKNIHKTINYLLLSHIFLLILSIPAFPQVGFYRIIGMEETTKVYINEDAIEDSAGKYPPGLYTLRVEKDGFHSYFRPIRIYSDNVVEVRMQESAAKLTPKSKLKRQNVRLRPITATLVLASNPPGQPVVVNQIERGSTPIALERLLSGEQIIQIGEVSDTLFLNVFETRRLRLEDGVIKDVTSEDLPTDQQGILIKRLDLFMEKDEEVATDCDNFYGESGTTFFRVDREGGFVVCRIEFEHSSSKAVDIPLLFRLYHSTSMINDVEHSVTVDPRKNNLVCYFHHEWWKPGEYILTIDGSTENRLSDIRFIIIR